jgi:ankyrin repeat protein
LNDKDHQGCTALNYACNPDFFLSNSTVRSFGLPDSSNANIILLLLKNGASVNVNDSRNRTVLHYAVSKSSYNYIKLLLDHGANINAVSDFGKTVLHEAFEEGISPNVEMIKLLLNRGVDANKRDNNQKTALDYAVTSTGSDELVKILFNDAAHDQLTDHVTFLHYAVYHGNCFAVELFLKRGLDLKKVKVDNAEYPLHKAVENQHLRSQLLLKITEFIRNCLKKGNFGKYFSNGYWHDDVYDDDFVSSDD